MAGNPSGSLPSVFFTISHPTVTDMPARIDNTPAIGVALFQKKVARRAGVMAAPYTVYAAYAASRILGKN